MAEELKTAINPRRAELMWWCRIDLQGDFKKSLLPFSSLLSCRGHEGLVASGTSALPFSVGRELAYSPLFGSDSAGDSLMAYQYVLPQELTDRLQRLGRRVRGVAVLAGCGQWLLSLAALFVGLMTADWLFDFEPSTRLMLLGCGVLVSAGLAVWWLVRPCVRTLQSAELAAFAEQQFPQLGERLTSLVELAQPQVSEKERGSSFMREMLERETLECLAECEIERAVPKQRALRSFWSGAGAVVVLLLSFVLFPSVSGMLFARIVNPWGNFESVGPLQFDVEGGDRVVARGSDVTIAVKALWRNGSDEPVPEPISLTVKSATGESDSRDLHFDAQANAFMATLPSVFDSFGFQVVGSGSRSARYQVTVVDAPSVLSAKLVVESPPYVGEPRREIDGVTGDIRVFERSKLQFNLTFNKPLKSAEIEWLSALVVPGTQYEKKSDAPADGEQRVEKAKPGPRVHELAPAIDELPRSAMQIAADGRSASLTIPAELQAIVAFRLTDEHGLTNEEPHRQLLITLDQPPLLEVAGSPHDEARPTDVYPLRLTAVDDFGIGALELHLKAESGLEKIIELPREKLGATSLEHEFRVDLADLALRAGDRLSLQVRAADERPVPGANEVWSSMRTVSLRDNASAPGAVDVAARQKEIKDELAALRKDIAAEMKKSDELQAAANQNAADKKPFAQAEQLQSLAEQEHQTAAALQDLAERFEEHPLFANLAPEAKKVAEDELKQLAQELAASTKFEPQDLAEQLQDNAAGLKQADEKLAALEKRFGELAKLERELLDVGRLAQRANQLADDATQLEEKRQELAQSPLLEGERAEDRAAAQEQLRQEQTQLGKEQDELLTALNKLLTEKPEIVQAARDHQLDRLAELAEGAKQLANKQDQLAEAIEQEATQRQAAAAPLAEKQAALAEQAQQLADQVEAQQARNPVAPLDVEALQKVLDDLKAGNAQAAAEQAQELANDAERAARELLQNEPLPADPRAAAKELAQRQRALADDIAKAAEQVGKGEEPQTPLRELAAREMALEKAAAQLDAGKEARDEQQAAVDQAAKAVNKLVEAAKAEADPQPTAPKNPEQRASAVAEQAAAQARQAADALDALAEAAQSPEQQQAAAVERAAEQKQTQERLAELQQRQDGLQQQAAEALKSDDRAAAAEQLRQVAEQERQLSEQVGELKTPQAQSAQRAAEQALEAAAEAIAQPPSQENAQAAMRALERADQALERLAQAANRAAPTDPQAEARQLAERVQEFAQQERDLAEAVAALNQPMGEPMPNDQPLPNGEQPPANGQPMPNATPQTSSNPMPNAGNQPPPNNDRPSARELAERQADLAAEAAEIAQQAEQQSGAESRAAEAARQAANQGEQAQQQARNGQLPAAAENAEQAAQSAQQAGEALRESSPGLAERARELAQQQQQVANQLEQLAADPTARAAAQRDQQRRLANETSNLQRELSDLAEQLRAAPLDLDQQSQQANQAGQAASEGQQSQRQAQQSLQQGNSGNAAAASEQAADSLRQAAEQAQNAQPGSGQPSDIPGNLASQLTTAAQRLQQAQQQLAAGQQAQPPRSQQPGQPASNQQGSPMSASNGQSADAQAANGQNGQPQASGSNSTASANGTPSQQPGRSPSGPAQAGQQSGTAPGENGQPGHSQPDAAQQALANSAEALRQAAEQLNQAANRLQADASKPQPGNRPRSISANQQQSANSAANSAGGEQGHQGPGETTAPNSDLQKQAQRNWGKLPGTLKTEILQSSQRKANGDYSKLIKLYFEELAKSGNNAEPSK